MNTLTFNDVNFNPVEHNGQIWLTSKEIAQALGYKNATSINKLYNANSDEFTDTMSLTTDMMVDGINNSKRRLSIRIFSLRGCHLLAMFARTNIAKAFRKWVLDILDKEVGAPRHVVGSQLTTDQTLPLRNSVNLLVTKSNILYSDAYKMVHHKFGVTSIKDLTSQQLDAAISYIHTLILNMSVKDTPLTSFTHNQYIVNVKNEVMDYVYSLQNIIVSKGEKLPKYPAFDKEEICQAFIVSMIKHNRMMLSFDFEGRPAMKFIPQEHAVVSRESIADVVQFADRSQLPNIISEAVKRLGQ